MKIMKKRVITITLGLLSSGSILAVKFEDIKSELWNRVYWWLKQDQLDGRLTIALQRQQWINVRDDKTALRFLAAGLYDSTPGMYSLRNKQKISAALKKCREHAFIEGQTTEEENSNCYIVTALLSNLLEENYRNDNGNPVLNLDPIERGYAEYIFPQYLKSFK